MKKRTIAIITAISLVALSLGTALASVSSLASLFAPSAQDTTASSFTYRGVLTDSGSPANGSYDFEFSIYADSTGAPSKGVAPAITRTAAVTNGVFTISLDFGADTIAADLRYLEIKARSSGATAFTTLKPRQFLSSVPFAVSADTASDSAQLAGRPASAYLRTSGGSISGSLTLNGQVRINSGTPGEGEVLTSDANGNAEWRPLAGQREGQLPVIGNVSDPRSLVVLHDSPGVTTTPFRLVSAQWDEELSTIFRAHLELRSGDLAIDTHSILGKEITVALPQPIGGSRFIHGIVASFEAGAMMSSTQRAYSAVIAPELALLSLTSDSRAFQEMTVPQVVELLLDEAGLSADMVLNESYTPRTFLVQYQESDFDFISRLLEEEGIYYYFQHTLNSHQLVISDAPSGYSNALASARLSLGQAASTITTWARQESLVSDSITLDDYSFETSADISVTRNATVGQPNVGPQEIYEYPGQYTDAGQGAKLARIRLQELEATRNIVSGTSSDLRLDPGTKFKLDSHPVASEQGEYLVIKVSHKLTIDPDSTPAALAYENEFHAVPSSTVYRPQRTTPQPIVSGPQVAVVVGPSGATTHADPAGRIKVQFPWDRLGQLDQNSSGWIPVQDWISTGATPSPTIGSHVLVDFLNGDPDRPIVIGTMP